MGESNQIKPVSANGFAAKRRKKRINCCGCFTFASFALFGGDLMVFEGIGVNPTKSNQIKPFKMKLVSWRMRESMNGRCGRAFVAILCHIAGIGGCDSI
jgi:hypothetical protein